MQYKQENTTSKMISQLFSPKVLLYGSKLESVTFGSQNIADDSTELQIIFNEINTLGAIPKQRRQLGGVGVAKNPENCQADVIYGWSII